MPQTIDDLAAAVVQRLEPKPVKVEEPKLILVRRSKSGLSCLSGFRKDKPVFAPRIQLAHCFTSEEEIIAAAFDDQLKPKPGFEGVEIWDAPKVRP